MSEETKQEQVDAEIIDEEEEARRVAEAIKRGEEAADKELAEDAKAAKAERDELAVKLSDLEDELDKAKSEAQDAANRVLRLQADWDNYRRRTAAERLQEKERAAAGVVEKLLPIIDDLERALEHAQTSEDAATQTSFVEGVAAVHTKLMDTLEREGLEVIDPKGQAFDPNEHQAISRVEDSSVYDETVAQVYQKGYKLAGKTLRNAMVIVSFGGPARPKEETQQDETASK